MNNADQPLPQSFWNALRDRTNPHQPQPGVSVAAQNMCGRWLALSRLRKGMLRSTLAAWVGTSDESLLLLEAGVAQPAQLGAAERKQLCSHLANETHDQAWVSAVCALALGEPVAEAERYLGEVLRELETFEGASAASLDLAKQPALFDMLDRLTVEASDAHQLWQACQHRQPTTMHAAAQAIQQLHDAGMIAQAAPARHDREPQAVYQITPRGRRALKQEQQRQRAAQATFSLRAALLAKDAEGK